MALLELKIPYPEELLRTLGVSREEFEAEARLLLAVKFYELDRLSTGRAAQVAGMSSLEFLVAFGRYGLSPINVDLRTSRTTRSKAGHLSSGVS